jgi:murein DD-endopeptidase MepM/ murein hydrolase activator NlpD
VSAVVVVTVLAVALDVLVHLYLARRLVRDLTPVSSLWRRLGNTLVVCSALLVVALMVTSPYEAPLEAMSPISAAAHWWTPFLGYLVVITVLCEPVRSVINHLASRGLREPAGPAERTARLDRRQFLDRTLAIGAVVVAGALGARSTMSSTSRRTPRETVSPPPPVTVALPFAGTWIARNSPARRIPSHGSNLLGTRYSIDFVAVDGRRRTATTQSWRTFLGTEPPDIFIAFGQPVLAPISGVVVAVHDGERDHEARRSQLALLPYMLGQMQRLRQGVGAIAGNHVLIKAQDAEVYVGVVHLQRGSIHVAVGQQVTEGQPLAGCGNSGNSTQPHVHLQAMDSMDLATANGLPLAFRSFQESPAGRREPSRRTFAVPDEESVVEA